METGGPPYPLGQALVGNLSPRIRCRSGSSSSITRSPVLGFIRDDGQQQPSLASLGSHGCSHFYGTRPRMASAEQAREHACRRSSPCAPTKQRPRKTPRLKWMPRTLCLHQRLEGTDTPRQRVGGVAVITTDTTRTGYWKYGDEFHWRGNSRRSPSMWSWRSSVQM